MKSKLKKVLVLAMVLMSVFTINAFADEVNTDNTVAAITSAFDTIKTTALSALAAIAGIAILLFGAIYAWRYAKKVFSIIAK